MHRRAWLKRSTAALGLALVPPVCANSAHRWSSRVNPAHALTAGADTPIYLDANENPYGPPPSALGAMQRALTGGNRYPDTADALRQALADRSGLTPEHVVLGHGSLELLCAAAHAFVPPSGEVVTPTPSFNVIADRAQRAGARIRAVPLTQSKALDIPAMARATTPSTDLVYVCNPNNPTGTIVPDRVLRPFCLRAAETAIVVVDEAYVEYVDAPEYSSLVDLIAEGRDIVVLRTFSKIYGLAGMRVGYALAHPDLAVRLRAHETGSLNGPGLAAASAALGDAAFVAESRARNAEARAVLLRHLAALGLRWADSHASFVWAHLGQPFRPVSRILQARGIYIGRPPDEQIPWGRISLGTPDQMDRLGHALAEVL